MARLLHELDLSTALLSRDDDDLKDEDLDDEADDGEGIVKLLEVVAEEEEDALSLYLLGLILKKLLLEGLELPDSSSLDWRPLSRKLEPSISPDRRIEPDPPPGLQDILRVHDKLN